MENAIESIRWRRSQIAETAAKFIFPSSVGYSPSKAGEAGKKWRGMTGKKSAEKGILEFGPAPAPRRRGAASPCQGEA